MCEEDGKYVKLLAEAVDLLRSGIDDIGRKSGRDIWERFIMASALKAIKIAEAVLLLCKHGFAEESLANLRSLVELSINLEYIAGDRSGKTLQQYLADLTKDKFGEQWTDVPLVDRMAEIGFGNRDYFDFVLKFTYSHAHVNAQSLRWHEVIDDKRLTTREFSAGAVAVIAAQAIARIIKVLSKLHPKHFEGQYESIVGQIPVSTTLREDYLKKLEEFKKEMDSEDD